MYVNCYVLWISRNWKAKREEKIFFRGSSVTGRSSFPVAKNYSPFIFRRCDRPSILSHVKWCTLDYKPVWPARKINRSQSKTPRGPGRSWSSPWNIQVPDCDSHYTARQLVLRHFLLPSRPANNSVRLAETAISPLLFSRFAKCRASVSIFRGMKKVLRGGLG